jgi:predicted extracellular nuclease
MSKIVASRLTYLEQTTSAYRTPSVEPDAPATWGGYDLVAAAALLGKQSPSLQVPALPSLEIYEIQGAGHVSAHVGATVSTQGIITAIDRSGFWLQSAVGDGDSATSDAIFVRHSVAGVAVGDAITVTGVVGEQARGPGLTITEISAQTVSVHSHGNALPEAILIGVNGILPPTSVIEDDSFGSYDPETDGLDFWESLEGMRVTLETPQAISNTNSYGETYLVASHGADATGMTIRGGLAIGEGDWNPEQIQLDDRLYDQPYLTVGDQLASVTGILGYGYNHYELVATERAVVTRDAVLTRETADFSGDANHLTVATYDLSNLDPYDARFASVANDIVNRLQSPDVIAVQRVQDADGRGTGTDLSGHATADRLIEAIFQQTGLRYVYVEIAPDEINSTAGQENGNVRNGYLYRPDRVELVEGSLQVIDHAIFDGTRSPLVATWSFNGEEVTTINVHFTTRYGSDPLVGSGAGPVSCGHDHADQPDCCGGRIYRSDARRRPGRQCHAHR